LLVRKKGCAAFWRRRTTPFPLVPPTLTPPGTSPAASCLLVTAHARSFQHARRAEVARDRRPIDVRRRRDATHRPAQAAEPQDLLLLRRLQNVAHTGEGLQVRRRRQRLGRQLNAGFEVSTNCRGGRPPRALKERTANRRVKRVLDEIIAAEPKQVGKLHRTAKMRAALADLG